MSVNPQLVGTMLQHDLDAARELISLLGTERELLETRQHDALPALIEQKNTHLHLLDHHAGERHAVLQNLGLKASAEGWETLLQRDPALATHLPLWQEVKEAVSECKRLNDINGKLINRSQQTLVRLLDLVRGKTAAPELYNAAGASTATPYSNTVAKA